MASSDLDIVRVMLDTVYEDDQKKKKKKATRKNKTKTALNKNKEQKSELYLQEDQWIHSIFCCFYKYLQIFGD